ncbi:MAG: hypothetical protein O3A00_18510 [Planctomycetota bacterium]|nr:hypothetical protein [Planctomycetota bacterium]
MDQGKSLAKPADSAGESEIIVINARSSGHHRAVLNFPQRSKQLVDWHLNCNE